MFFFQQGEMRLRISKPSLDTVVLIFNFLKGEKCKAQELGIYMIDQNFNI